MSFQVNKKGKLTIKRKRFTEEQIIGILKQAEAGDSNQEICRKNGITEQTFYRWRSKYGGMQVSDAKRLKELESENQRIASISGMATLEHPSVKAECHPVSHYVDLARRDSRRPENSEGRGI